MTVEVGPGGNYKFSPGTSEPLYITPGTTVKWIWKSDNHNIVVGSQPDGTDWKGTPGGKSKTYDSGYTYTHTFETKGEYHYWCQPHKALGMVGDIVVNESGSPPSSGGGGGGGQQIPKVPKSAKLVGVTATGAMVAVFGLGLFFLKYGGTADTPDLPE